MVWIVIGLGWLGLALGWTGLDWFGLGFLVAGVAVEVVSAVAVGATPTLFAAEPAVRSHI